MNILVLNTGSSSLKYELISFPNEVVLTNGNIEEIGRKNSKAKNHKEAIQVVFNLLKSFSFDCVAHRVVHGGEYFSAPVIINKKVIKKIKELSELAPIHNPLALEAINETLRNFPNIKQVAVFDTSFHQTIPEINYLYAIPKKYYQKYKIRKYGFHGISYEFALAESRKILKKSSPNLVIAHLGNGSSVCAIRIGKSFDTSMGFTPLQGLMMATRSGDLDPAIIPFLEQKEKISAKEILEILNKESGFRAISGEEDFRIIHDKAKSGDKKSRLALAMFENQIVKCIAGYMAEIENTDALIFTGGIGEGADYLRESIRKKLNLPSKKILVIKANESLMIARHAFKLL